MVDQALGADATSDEPRRGIRAFAQLSLACTQNSPKGTTGRIETRRRTGTDIRSGGDMPRHATTTHHRSDGRNNCMLRKFANPRKEKALSSPILCIGIRSIKADKPNRSWRKLLTMTKRLSKTPTTLNIAKSL